MKITRHGSGRSRLRRRPVVLAAVSAAALLGLLLLTPAGAAAQEAACDRLAVQVVLDFVDGTVGTVTVILVSVAVLFVIYGGAMYMWSRGTPQGMEGAKLAILSTLGGIGVILLAATISNLVIDELKPSTVAADESCIGSSGDSGGDGNGNGGDGSQANDDGSAVPRYRLPDQMRLPWES